MRNFSVPMLNMDNKPIKLIDQEKRPVLGEDGQQKTMLLSEIVEAVLSETLPDNGDKELTGVERNGLISCAMRVREGGPREYTIDELGNIKKRALKFNITHLQYFRLSEVIDAPDAPAEPTKTE